MADNKKYSFTIHEVKRYGEDSPYSIHSYGLPSIFNQDTTSKLDELVKLFNIQYYSIVNKETNKETHSNDYNEILKINKDIQNKSNDVWCNKVKIFNTQPKEFTQGFGKFHVTLTRDNIDEQYRPLYQSTPLTTTFVIGKVKHETNWYLSSYISKTGKIMYKQFIEQYTNKWAKDINLDKDEFKRVVQFYLNTKKYLDNIL